MKSEHKKRGRHPMKAHQRKDRIVQTRVPKALDRTLQQAAKEQRMSVSQLVRNVLEDTFSLVDGIVADSATLLDDVARDTRKIVDSAVKGAPDNSADDIEIDAWQSVITNHDVHCYQCQSSLPGGSHAWRATGPSLKESIWCCDTCLPGKIT